MFIVDRHHLVLTAWSHLRRTLAEAPRLISLDHHTDTSPSFRNHLNGLGSLPAIQKEELREKLVRALDFRNSESIFSGIKKLNNDEHIVAAIQSDIISSAFVVAHKAANTDVQTYHAHRIACWSVDSTACASDVSREDCDRVLTSEFLTSAISRFDQILAQVGESPLLATPYILDIDLDYFNTAKGLSPLDSNVFRSLWHNASLVTIATEPDYVDHCALDPDLDSAWILEKLQNLIWLPTQPEKTP